MCRRGLHEYAKALKQCPACKAARDRAWRTANIARHKETNRAWYLANIERARARDLAWRTKNGDRNRERAHKWRADNPDREKEKARSWAARNRDSKIAALKRWKSENAVRVRESRQVRRARLRNAAIEPVSAGAWTSVVSFYKGMCAYCGEKPWAHQDHVVPISRGGAHAIGNLVPACAGCNMRKHAKTWVPLAKHPFMEAYLGR